MKKLIIAALAMLSATALAGSRNPAVPWSWDAPTSRTDGAPLAAQDIIYYVIYDTQSPTASPVYVTPERRSWSMPGPRSCIRMATIATCGQDQCEGPQSGEHCKGL